MIARTDPGTKPEARPAIFIRVVEEELHPDADPEQGTVPRPERFNKTLSLEALHGGTGGPDAGQDDGVGTDETVRVSRRSAGRPPTTSSARWIETRLPAPWSMTARRVTGCLSSMEHPAVAGSRVTAPRRAMPIRLERRLGDVVVVRCRARSGARSIDSCG